MFKRLIHILGLVVAGLVIGMNSYSQTYPLDPTTNYNDLPGGVNASTGNSDVCPSIAGTPSQSTFQVAVNMSDAGTTWFEWVVYGGRIVNDNGTITPGNDASSGTIGGVPYFYISDDDYNSGVNSSITVEWHTADVANAWVAVRQHSEWGCYAGPWSVYVNNIFNQEPVFDNFPTDITIAFDSRLSFVLPVPPVTDADAGCPLPLSYTYEVTGASSHGPTTVTDATSRTIDLGVGVNTVTWTITDGMKPITNTYRITVDPQPVITHIAWIDPLCAGEAYGSLYVSDTVNYTFGRPLQYSLNGGVFTPARQYGGLLAGAYTLQARVSYDVDIDFDGDLDHYDQLSPLCSGALRDPAAQSVDAVPPQTDGVNVSAIPPSCATSTDGYIYVNPASMTPENRSFSFNGTSDHIRLNKFYDSEVSAVSIAAWIKVPAGALASSATIVSFNNARHFQLSVTQSTGGSQSSYVRFETCPPSGSDLPLDHSQKINDGLWHLVVATFNNGVRTIYIDGIGQSNTASSATLGTSLAASYGCIGARMASSTFGAAPEGNYFRGTMTDLGIWNSALDLATVTSMMKNGIGSAGPSAYWVLNDLPSVVSPGQSGVFSDIGNSNIAEWGRVYGGSLSANDAPVLYSWLPDSGTDTELEDIPSGNYQLSVKDIFGCTNSAVTQTYTLTNNDQSPPKILVNLALLNNSAMWGRASQSGTGTIGGCGNASAHLAVDGILDNVPGNCSVSATDGGTDEYWQIDLGLPSNLQQVRILHASSGAPTDFYVMLSSSPMTSLGDTARSNVRFKHSIGVPPGLQVFDFSGFAARYLRINAVGAGALMLAEVEALSGRTGKFTRTLYLGSDDCSYVVGSYDGSIDPVPYDNCGTIASFTHNQVGLDYNNSLYGMEFPLAATPTPVVWTVIDDSPDTTMLTIDYTVLDTIVPRFTNPYHNWKDTISWCDVTAGYKVPIPNATDNYNCPIGITPNYSFQGLTLKIDGNTVRTFNNSQYDPLDIDDSLTIDQVYLAPALTHRFVWEVTDFSSRSKRDTFYVYVQTKPQITSLRDAPLTCYNNDDGIIHINGVQYEAGETVTYYLRTSTDTLSQLTPLFNTLSPNTYYAWIVVDGCKSGEYFGGRPINITEPVDINPTLYITPVPCFGDSGSIDIDYPALATKQYLHLLGGANNVIVAPNYAGLNLSTSGMVEALVYFDTLSATGINNDAGLVNCLNGAGGYGLRMVNGVLNFTVGGVTLTDPGASIAERQWVHVAGSWDAAGTYLYINHGLVSTGPAASNSEMGGSLYMGCLGAGPEENNLHGFIRFVRVWSSALTSAETFANSRFVDPINYNSSLVANYPINVSQGAQLPNLVSSGSTASLVTASALWQSYAYHWDGVTTPLTARTEDLIEVPAQQYHYYVTTPYCSWDSLITLEMDDRTAPSVRFYNEDHTTINQDGKLNRTTGQTTSAAWITLPDLLNVAGDCWYTAQGGEFDPVIDDHGCPASQVTLTWAYSDSSVTGSNTVNLTAFQDTTTLVWRATDGAGNFADKTINYYIRDNEAPVLSYRDSTVNADPGECTYRVPNATTFVPTVADNCLGNGGNLRNNYPGGGFGSNLNGVNIPVGVHDITWIYTDKWGMEASITQRITVVDNQPPTANCIANLTVDLNSSGIASIDSSRINNNSRDNCSLLRRIKITKNIAYHLAGVSQSSTSATTCSGTNTGTADKANDGIYNSLFTSCSSTLTNVEANPYWEINLGGTYTIYGINVYNSNAVPLDNFYVLVSDNGTFGSIGTFDPHVVYRTLHNSGNVTGSQLFNIPGGVTGSHVRIWMNQTAALSLAEVEVFGTTTPTGVSNLTLNCNDVRYSGTPGIFNPSGILLTAIDQYNNSASCRSNVTVRDDVLPDYQIRNYTVSPDASGIAYVSPDSLYRNASDACGIDTVFCFPTQFACNNKGDNNVTLHVVDNNGNDHSEIVTVTVLDTVPPVAIARANVRLYVGTNGIHVINPQADVDGGSYDNCGGLNGIVLYEVNPDTVTCSMIGTSVPLQFTVTDASDNKTTILVNGQVFDNIAPIPTIKNFTLTLPSSGDTVVYFSDFDDGSFDNCGTVPIKSISFTHGSTWCDAGDELSGAAAQSFLDRTDVATISGSADYTGYPLSNAIDAAGVSTAYITNRTSGADTVMLQFPGQYVLNRSTVEWHTETFIPISQQISHTEVVTINGSPGYTGGTPLHSLAKMRDGLMNSGTNYTNSYVTNVTGTAPVSDEFYVEYIFSGQRTFTRTNVRWCAVKNNTGTPNQRVDLPTSARIQCFVGGTWTNIPDVLTRNAGDNDIVFATPVTSDRIRIIFDDDNRRVGIEEWYVYGYSGSRLYDCSYPTSANIEYWNGAGWSNFGTGVMTVGAGVNTSAPNPLSPVITTDRVRLRFTRTNAHMGISNWRVYGYPVGSASGCLTWTCDSVWTTQDVWLLYEDSHGNDTIIYTSMDIEPNFEITEIQLKDCAVVGEQYWSWINNRPDNFEYHWTQLQNPPTWPNLFSTAIGGDIGDNEFISNTETIAQLRTGRDILPSPRYYTINLQVTDVDNGCWDDLDYTFWWDNDLSGGGGGAVSVKPWEVCIGDTVTFNAELVEDNTYWNFINYNWDPDIATPISGGGITDASYTVAFNANDTTDVQYGVQGDQEYVRFGPDGCSAFPNVRILPNPTNITCTATNPCYDFGTDFTGPFVLSEATLINDGASHNFAGRNVVRLRDAFGDCGNFFDCDEGVRFHTTVYDVSPPDYETPILDVCPCDTITYRIAATYTSHDWTVTGGNIIRGGNGNDNYATVVWSCNNKRVWDGDSVASVTLEVFNPLGCSADSSFTVNFDTDINSIPTIVCPNDTTQAIVNGCQYTFPNLPTPLTSDACRVKSYVNNFNNTNNARGTYDLGRTVVTWQVSDYYGNTNSCQQRITIIDNQSPRFYSTPLSTPVNADGDCDVAFPDNSCDVAAYDNCDITGTALHYLTVLDHLDDMAALDSFPNTNSIQGLTFDLGVTRVYYTVTDTADTWNSGTGPNSRTISFLVVVVDQTSPEFDALPDIILNNSPGLCASNDDVTTPDATIYTRDNCTLPANIDIRFVQRSDGLPLDDPFQVGTTTVNWEASDDALPSNKNLQSQLVTVTDVEDPVILPMNDSTITACDANGHKLRIPSTDDNCQVDTLIFSVANVPSAYFFSDTITTAGFNPYGNGHTQTVPTLIENRDYTVTWRAIDHWGNETSISNNLRVEVQPSFPLDSIYTSDVSCGGARDGAIIINGVEAENGATVEYSINGGTTWQTNNNRFTGLDINTYGVVVRVNGCISELVETAIQGPAAYNIDATLVHPYCSEGHDGAISISMGGGSPAQLLLSGTGSTVNNYPQIAGNSSGMIEAWVYLMEDSVSAGIINKPGSYELGILNGRPMLRLNGTTWLGDAAGVNGVGSVLKDHRWYHIAGSWEAGSSMQIYVNGSLQAGTVHNGPIPGTINQNGSSLVLGGGMNGIVREARVWTESYATVSGYLGGDPANVQLTGGEDYLGGCWPLTDGLSPSTNKFSGNSANPGSSWSTGIPQPGSYTWTLPGGFTRDSINISGLITGEYILTFRDNFGCPAAGLVKRYTLKATDQIPPSISPKAPQYLDADPGDCSHKILASDTLTLLPLIENDDGYDCNWSTLWSVFSESTSTGIYNVSTLDLLGYDLEYGLNEITVTASQNGYTTSRSLEIYVEDHEKPNAIAQVPANIYLNGDVGNGNISIAAKEFNNASNDNCTSILKLSYTVSVDNGANFEDSAHFTCSALTEPAEVVLRARDEDLNWDDSEMVLVTVSDTTRPVFLQPMREYNTNCATTYDAFGVGYVNGIDGLYLVPWDGFTGDYGDNCGIDRVEYRIINATRPQYNDPLDEGDPWYFGDDASARTFYEGTSYIIFRIYDPSGNVSEEKAMIQVIVLDMPTPGGLGGD